MEVINQQMCEVCSGIGGDYNDNGKYIPCFECSGLGKKKVPPGDPLQKEPTMPMDAYD